MQSLLAYASLDSVCMHSTELTLPLRVLQVARPGAKVRYANAVLEAVVRRARKNLVGEPELLQPSQQYSQYN
jgi:hypothetical protein